MIVPTPPELKRYDAQPGVKETPVPGIRYSTSRPADDTREFQTAQDKLFQAMGAVAKEEQLQADSVVHAQAAVDETNLRNKILFDEKDGITNTMKGREAAGATEEFNRRYEKGTEEILKGLTNNQREKYASTTGLNGRISGIKEMEAYSNNEIKNYQKNTYAAVSATDKNNMVVYSHDDNVILMNYSSLSDNLPKLARAMDLTGEAADRFVAKGQSDAILAVVERRTDRGDTSGARKFLEDYGHMLIDKDVGEADKIIKAGSVRGESQQWAMELSRSGKSTREQFDEVRDDTKKSPEIKDATLDYLRQIKADEETNRRRADEELTRNVLYEVEKTRRKPDVSVWEKLPIEAKRTVETRLQQLAEGIPATTNRQLYQDLMTMASSDTMANEFLKRNLPLDADKLSETDWKMFVQLQASMRTKDGKADVILRGVRSRNDVVNQTLTKIGIDTSPEPGSSDSENYADFNWKVDEEIKSFHRRNKKDPDALEIQRIVDDLLKKVRTEKRWWWADKTKLKFQLKPGEEYSPIDSVPGNIDLSNRPRVKMPDGSTRTVYPMSFGTDKGEVLLPTVSDDGKIMTPKEAWNQYERTGRHLGIYKDRASADKAANRIHLDQEKLLKTRPH